MANPKDLTGTVDDDVDEEPEVPEEDESSVADDEPDEDLEVDEYEEPHCSKYGCRYFLLTVAIVYFGIIGMACFFMYLGRFSVLRGFNQVKEKFHSFTYANFENVATGRDSV